MESTSPQPQDIISLASSLGYKERRSEISATLFFQELNPAHNMPPVRINIYYTTRSIMTHLNHPTAGTNELWRSNAYNTIEELTTFLENPRRHSGKGYRTKDKSTRGCVECGTFQKRAEFSKNQWSRGPDSNRCKNCVAKGRTSTHVGGVADDVSQLSDAFSGVEISAPSPSSMSESFEHVHVDGIDTDTDADPDTEAENEEVEEFPALTTDLLQAHDKKSKNGNRNSNQKARNSNNNTRMERRQFNCPECPKHGRGKYVFFKKVPAYKPIVKCSQCKKVTRGRCKRLYPIPKTSEKGYGLFRCRESGCGGKWGSSRAVAKLGQECYDCKKKGKENIFVKPFRLEVVKKKRNRNNSGAARGNRDGGILGGGPAKGRMKRVPREEEQIGEEEEANVGYTPHDQQRNARGGNDALVGGSANYQYQYDDLSSASSDASSSNVDTDYSETTFTSTSTSTFAMAKVGVPSGYVHNCEGCATGICKSRYLPKSLEHDTSDGNTVSTRASVVTNSSIDKADYIDRDEDFDGFDEVNDLSEDSWSVVSN